MVSYSPFAGLWERWKDPAGTWVKSCAILTTTPNAVTAAVHDRMPEILNPEPMARSWVHGCSGSVRTVEALCEWHALLPGERAGQQRRER
jgi:putative SOS response-associated peptidase YedK